MSDKIRSNWTALSVVITLAASFAGCGGGSTSTSKGDPPGPCQSGSLTACNSFTTPTGVMLPLGPYGAIMDPNVGTGFENAIQSGDMLPANASTCQAFAALFNQSAALTSDLLNTSQNGVDLNFALYTVYRPATWPTTGPIPVITWGNGTCAQPEGYGALLRYVASYGYFVVAANSRFVGSGSPEPMLHALDFAEAANKDSSSPYYQKLDLTKIGAMGHSQGGSATVTAASDPRILDIIIFNAADSAPKPYLAVSGDTDITNFTPSGMASAINASTVPAAWLFYHMVPNTGNLNGHLTLMLQPQRVTGPTVAWWQMMFEKDATATAQFEGSSCGLCNQSSEFEYGEHGLN